MAHIANKGEESSSMGRKPRYEKPEQMQEAIGSYFEECDRGIERQIVTKRGEVKTITQKIPYTVEGMAYHLGFCDRSGMWRYKEKDPKTDEIDPERLTFGNILSRAKLRIKNHRIVQTLLGNQESRMAMLDLACNFGMQPKLQLPEGAKIIIGYSNAAASGGELPDNTTPSQPIKPEQITE